MTATQAKAVSTIDIATAMIRELSDCCGSRQTMTSAEQLNALRNVVMIDFRLQPGQLPASLNKFYTQVQGGLTHNYNIRTLMDQLNRIITGAR